MSLNLPSNRTEVYNRIISDFNANAPQSGAGLATSFLNSLIKAFSFRLFDCYQKVLIMINQFFVQTAASPYIERWGDFFGITKNPATSAKGNIVVGGTNTTIIATDTEFLSLSGIVYKTTADATITTTNKTASSVSRLGTTVTVDFATPHGLASGITIDAITGATPSDFNGTNLLITVTSPTQFQYTLEGTSGAASGTIDAQWTTAILNVLASSVGENTNLAAGAILTLSSPLAGVNDTGFVDFYKVSGGADVESADSYRKRVLFRVQSPFSFFNKNAILNQIKKVSGITRAWVFGPDDTVVNIAISQIVLSGNIATATSTAHGLTKRSLITITGADQSAYNVISASVLVVNANSFAFVVTGSPTSPATGTITGQYSYVEPGQIRVGFVRDNDDDIIPDAGEVNDARDKLLEIKPAHMASNDLMVFAPTAVPVDITFSTLTPNTPAMQKAITDALTGFFKSSNNIASNVTLLSIVGLISQIIDSSGSTPKFTLSAPSADVAIGVSEIATLGTITYPS